jgi:hypothetical protein
MSTEYETLVEFARWVIRNSAFAGGDLPGDEVQDKALALGLLREEVYDREKHRAVVAVEDYDGDPGDPIMLFAGPLALDTEES